MPIAEYTLDAGFDEARIRVLEPPGIVAEAHKFVRTQRVTECQLLLDPPVAVGPVNQRKRRIGNEEDLQHDVQRPKKKMKGDAYDPVRITDTERPITVSQQQQQKLSTSAGDEPCARKAKHVVFQPKLGLSQTEAVAKARDTFKKSIVRTENFMKPQKADTRSIYPLNPHTLFWNNIFAESFPRNGTAVLKVIVKDLVHAPRTKAVIFDVNKTYLGKPFINLENDENITTAQ